MMEGQMAKRKQKAPSTFQSWGNSNDREKLTDKWLEI